MHTCFHPSESRETGSGRAQFVSLLGRANLCRPAPISPYAWRMVVLVATQTRTRLRVLGRLAVPARPASKRVEHEQMGHEAVFRLVGSARDHLHPQFTDDSPRLSDDAMETNGPGPPNVRQHAPDPDRNVVQS